MKNSFLFLVIGSMFVGNLFAEPVSYYSDVEKDNSSHKENPFNISAQFEANQGKEQYDLTYGAGLGLDKKIKSFDGWDLIGNVDLIIKKVDNYNGKSSKSGGAIDTEAGLTVQKDNFYVAGKVGMNAFSTEDTYGEGENRFYSKIETGYRTKSGSSIGIGAIMNINDHAKNNPNRVVDGIYVKSTYGF